MADQNFKTSFIPAKPIQPVSRGGNLGAGHTSFLNVITLIIFLVTLVVSGGVFGYKIYLQGQVEKQLAQLADVRQKLDSPLVNEADRLNTRIESVKVLLQNHLAPSELFSLLEQSTLKTVQFDSLEYKVEPDGVIRLMGDGKALGYASVVLQSKQYGATQFLRNILFSGTQPNQQLGGINFSLDGTVDKALVLYRKRVERENPSSNNDDAADTSAGDSFEFPDGGSNSN